MQTNPNNANLIHPMTREVQICLITGKPNSIIKWFDKLWNGLLWVDMIIDGCDTTVYYTRQPHGDPSFIFYLEKEFDSIVCCYYNFWSLLKHKEHLTDKSARDIIKLLVDTKLSIVNPNSVVCIIPEQTLYKVNDNLFNL